MTGIWTRLQGMDMGSCSHSNDIYLAHVALVNRPNTVLLALSF